MRRGEGRKTTIIPSAKVFMDELARELRVIRRLRGLTLVQASKRVGMSVSALTNIELGNQSPPIPTVFRLLEAYEYPAQTFFTYLVCGQYGPRLKEKGDI